MTLELAAIPQLKPPLAKVLASMEEAHRGPIPEPPEPYGGDQISPGISEEPLARAASVVACRPAYSGSVTPRGCLPLRLRSGVLERLAAAQQSLGKPFELILLDGWRSRAFQEELGNHYGPRAVDANFVADPHADTAVPPHVTGGAMDLTIGIDGQPLALGTHFDEFTPHAHLTALEHGQPSPERLLRRVLYDVLVRRGFSPYSLEWWHFSYGDQNWADFYRSPRAIYGEARP